MQVKHRHAFADKPYFFRFAVFVKCYCIAFSVREVGTTQPRHRFLDIESCSTSEPETEAGSVLSDQDPGLEGLYDNLWSKRTPGNTFKQARSSKWSVASDVTRLQRRVAELTSDLEACRCCEIGNFE